MYIVFKILSFTFLLAQFNSLDDRSEIRKIDSLNRVAIEHYNLNEMSKAISTAGEALERSSLSEDNYGLTLSNYTLGQVFISLDEKVRSKVYFLEAYKLAENINENYLAAMSNLQLAEITLLEENGAAKALDYYETAKRFALNPIVTDNANNDQRTEVLFLVYMGLAKTYLRIDDTQMAFKNIDLAQQYLIGDNLTPYNEGYYNFIFGKYYHALELYASATEKFYQAKEVLLKSTDGQIKTKLLLADVYKTYALSLSGLGKDRMAYLILEDQLELQTEIANSDRIKYEKIAKTKLDIAYYKRETQLANKEKTFQSELKDRARQLNYIVILASLLLFAAALFFYKAYISKRKVAKVLKIRNEQLAYSREKVLHSSKLKSEFISNVSHELRTPMYGVVGLTSMLAESQNLVGKDLHIVNSLKFTSDYLLKLINNILQISKIEADEVVLNDEPTNLRILTQNLTDSFKQALKEKDNKLICKIDSSVPKFVLIDGLRLSQILMNLLGNSIKFTKNGTIHLSVEVLDSPDSTFRLRFSVKDDGIGIPQHKQASIFEKFSQVSNKDDELNRGTGLGLPISNKIAMLLGGKIELISELGLGSQFSFELNCEEAQAMDGQAQNHLLVNTNDSIKPIQGRIKILVAEDNKINQMVTKNMLEKENFECVVVENGLLALEAFKNGAFDLVLMDINMPVMNGKDATIEIRKLNQQVPIFALTAADIQEIKEDAKNLGFNEIVIKPFDSKELCRKIYTAVSSYKVIMANGKLHQVI